eukprot:g5610.t1
MKSAIFFINAAPFADMIDKLKQFHGLHSNSMKILWACNLDEFMRDASTDMRKNVPSNARVFDGGIGFKLNSKSSFMIGPGKAALNLPWEDPSEISLLTTDDMFKRAQYEVTQAIIDMFNYATDNKIPVYFAMPKREDRPFSIAADGRTVKPKPVTTTEHDVVFTQAILKKYVIPAYGTESILADLLQLFSKYKASNLADIYTLAMAFIEDDAWDGHDIVSIRKVTGIYKKAGVLSKQLENVPYAKMELKAGGQIFSLKEDKKHVVLEKLKEIYSNSPNIDHAFVVHDTLLNDVDDAVARRWIESVTTQSYGEMCNYNREHFQVARKWPNADFKPGGENIDDFHTAKLRKNIFGDIDERTQRIINPRVDPNVFVSAYHSFFGITGGIVDNNGCAVLLPEEERQNAFTEEQTPSCFNHDGKQMFMICRNAPGKGGTVGAKDGEGGSKWKISQDKDGNVNRVSNFESEGGSMSEWHEFVIPTDTSMYWCNAMFFGSGPEGSPYDVPNTLKMLYRLKQIGEEWRKARKIENPYFGFHKFPQNSLFHLHMHCIDLDQVQTSDGKNLPGFESHFAKTLNLKHYIDKLEADVKK